MLTLAQTALESEDIVRLSVFGIIGLVVLVAIAGGVLKSMANTDAREKTKREIAAYVAEGSIKPEDAVRILAAGQGTDAKEMIAKRAADGWISAKKADQLMQALEKRSTANV